MGDSCILPQLNTAFVSEYFSYFTTRVKINSIREQQYDSPSIKIPQKQSTALVLN